MSHDISIERNKGPKGGWCASGSVQIGSDTRSRNFDAYRTGTEIYLSISQLDRSISKSAANDVLRGAVLRAGDTVEGLSLVLVQRATRVRNGENRDVFSFELVPTERVL